MFITYLFLGNALQIHFRKGKANREKRKRKRKREVSCLFLKVIWVIGPLTNAF
ncbi:hypothetical protein SLEP1_g54424 [Rubroshorea leprosula]|uniref:Uncharacterized protein n=1 Tax=Rubroshorea leprosula TaxID=152421 RepID=A0AAV5MCC1_9ROSI|nr:hypothetical protein SLEP1_g54424 [Rubroshorea leprosula]